MSIFTEAEQNSQALRDDAEKLRLERFLASDMSRIFFRMRNDLREFYIATGGVIAASSYQAEVDSALQRQYRRIINSFGDDVFDDILEKTPQADLAENEEIADEEESDAMAFLIPYSFNHATDQAAIILSTTQGEINQAFTDASLDIDPTITDVRERRTAIAAAAAVGFAGLTRNRPNVIAVTETQNATEFTKLTTFKEVANSEILLEGQPADEQQSFKVWHTILDDRERPAHHDANKQRVPLNEPFVVGDELLDYPGDTSMGATLGNIINCRCTLTYENE